MFGYVRPLKDELKVREYERFRRIYCGLCRTLKRRCGALTSLVLTYDFTFLAMLLEASEEAPCSYCRCCANPFRKRRVCPTDAALELAADMSVVTGWLKLRDNVRDLRFSKALAARLGVFALKPAYRCAARRIPWFSEKAEKLLAELCLLEAEHCRSIDETADKFACLTASCVDFMSDESRKRILHQLLYHVGRWIYIIDAADDMDEDAKNGSYNAVSARFGASDTLSDEDRETLRITLANSLSSAASAYELLERGCWSEILDNIIYLGMTAIQERVLSEAEDKERDI